MISSKAPKSNMYLYQLCSAQDFLPFFALHQVLNSNARECFSGFIRVHFPLFVQLVLDYLEVKQGKMLSKRKGLSKQESWHLFKWSENEDKYTCRKKGVVIYVFFSRLFLKSFLCIPYVSAFITRVSFLFIKQTLWQDFFDCNEKAKKW